MGTHMKWKANIMYWPIFGLFVFYDINQFDPQVPICRWLLGSTEIFVGFVTMLQCNIGSDYLIPSSLFFPATCLLLNCSHEPPDHPPSNTGGFLGVFLLLLIVLPSEDCELHIMMIYPSKNMLVWFHWSWPVDGRVGQQKYDIKCVSEEYIFGWNQNTVYSARLICVTAFQIGCLCVQFTTPCGLLSYHMNHSQQPVTYIIWDKIQQIWTMIYK